MPSSKNKTNRFLRRYGMRLAKLAILLFVVLLCCYTFSLRLMRYPSYDDRVNIIPLNDGSHEQQEDAFKEEEIETTAKPRSLKVILYWNTFFGIQDFTLGFGQQPLIDAKCPTDGCFFTDNRTLFNHSDVVIFSFQNMSLADLPTHRLPHQRFVFYEMESPENTDPRPMAVAHIRHGFFNWTMTYRLDSDIVHRDSYGVVIPHQKGVPSRYPVPRADGKRTVQFKNPSAVNVKNKKKLVAWFVSHCKTTSKREDYVNELSRYVPVDIYGKCGNLSCPVRHECWNMLKTDYKFYVGFENSLCPDYVTEKLTRSLIYETVPLVFGGVDYSQFAPPHSVINVADYATPKALADHLLLLDKSDDLYARYFDWKRDYTVSTATKQGWCRLCEMAHADLPIKVYDDIHKWWIQDAACLPGWTMPKS